MEQSRLIPFAPSVKCEQASIEWQRVPVKRIPRTNFHMLTSAPSVFALGMMTVCRHASTNAVFVPTVRSKMMRLSSRSLYTSFCVGEKSLD